MVYKSKKPPKTTLGVVYMMVRIRYYYINSARLCISALRSMLICAKAKIHLHGNYIIFIHAIGGGQVNEFD